jgi:enediyne biosynthesis protein E4
MGTGAGIAVVACIALSAGCGRGGASPAVRTAIGPPVFVDVAHEAGIDAENHTGVPGEKDWVGAAMGGGVIVLDYDQDGRMDAVLVDGTMLTREGELRFDDAWRTRVFHNDGGMRFTDVTARSGVDLRAFALGGASCDYDADGWPDFYVCCWGRNRLYHNRGDGTFEDVTGRAGVAGGDDEFGTACAWGDVNGDGVHDLYVANYVDLAAVIAKNHARGAPGRSGTWKGMTVYPGPRGLPGQADRLYFGNGDGTFRDVTATNLPKEVPPGYGFQPVMTDLDNDGDLDVYVANDGVPSFLLVNDGHGKFAECGVAAGAARDVDGRALSSMGVDVADVNRDGWLDVFVTNFAFEHNALYLNRTGRRGVLHFDDASNAYNVADPARARVSWGTKLLDYDNDGELDLFAACGHVYGEIPDFEKNTGSSYRETCLLERGTGPPSHAFADVTGASGPAFTERRVWRGAGFADFDDDGDLDVLVTALNDRAGLFRNDGGNRNGFLVFRLVGKGGLRDPSGARVTVQLASGSRVEELHHGASYCSDNDPRLFFGTGSETSARRVEVRWPGGQAQAFENVAARRFYVVDQATGELREDVRAGR